ncbi:MAG TPA: BatA domain-containing protein [Kiritimatiellia bacterium]|nr:BatA domain-containing protein [Kiritimatiellia bacterium]
MISFLNPLFLAALGALTLPLILHLIQSSRTERLPFSTVRFLKLAQKRSSRRIRMENLLLLILRLLLLALLALAFAMPILRTRNFGSLLSRTSRDVAIVLDGSYSMNYRLNQQSVWNQATELAAAIVEGLGDNDRFCIYLAGDQVTPICEQMTGKKDEATARLRALPMPVGSSRLCPATLAALGTLNQEGRRGERELHILSDHQMLPWVSFSAGGEGDATAGAAGSPDPVGDKWDPSAVQDNTTCFVTLLGTPNPENAAVLNVELEPRLITAQTPCQVTVNLKRTGTPLETAVHLLVDGKETARRSVMLGGEDEARLRFAFPPLEGGVHTAQVTTPDDSLTEDNAFHFLIHVRERLPALCVGSKENALFLRTALSVSADAEAVSSVEVKNISVAELGGENLSAYSCVFLCNVLPLPGQQISLLERYAAAGGLIVLFPGDGAAVSDYAQWNSLPATPAAITEWPLEKRKQLLTWVLPQHPSIRGLVEGGIAPRVVIKRQLQCETLKEKAQVVVATSAGVPFLINRPAGRGAVVMLTVSADRSWSDFPLSAFYLPLAHQLIQYAAGVGARPPYLWATDSLSLNEFLPEATRHSTLSAPNGKPVPLRSVMVEGEAVAYAEGLMAPGIYKLSTPGGGGAQPALAINMLREESDLATVKPADISSILGVSALHVATGKEDLMKQLEDFRIGRSLGEALLWLTLLVAVVEVLYANSLLRKTAKLTDTMKIAPSGRVKEKEA